jgi:hypothetical protein
MALHALLAVVLGLTFIKMKSHEPPAYYLSRGGALRAVMGSAVVMWPYLASGLVSVPQLTSRHRDFWFCAVALLLGSVAMVALISGRTIFPPTTWNTFVGSIFEATAYLYVAHYCLDGIEP